MTYISPVLQELDEKGLIYQVTDGLDHHLAHPRSIYTGIDPTADQIHDGHKRIFDVMKVYAKHGHTIYILIGEFTAQVGDPTGRATARPNLSAKDANYNQSELFEQIFDYLPSARYENNIDWLEDKEYVFDCFRHINANKILKLRYVQDRLAAPWEHSDFSFAEFCYPAYQAIDFLTLKYRKDVTVQVGGADQWGNICAGIDLIKRRYEWNAFGQTVPLLTDEFGNKISKTGGFDVV